MTEEKKAIIEEIEKEKRALAKAAKIEEALMSYITELVGDKEEGLVNSIAELIWNKEEALVRSIAELVLNNDVEEFTAEMASILDESIRNMIKEYRGEFINLLKSKEG